MRRFLAALFLTAMIPYVVTLAWTGRLDSEDMAGMPELFGLPEGTGDLKDRPDPVMGPNGRRRWGKSPLHEPVVLLSRGGPWRYKVSERRMPFRHVSGGPDSERLWGGNEKSFQAKFF